MTNAHSAPLLVFEVPGEPAGKGRPRFARVGGGMRAFTPEKTANYEAMMSWYAQAAMAGRPLLEGPLWVHVSAFFAIPASWPKAKIALARAGLVYATKKPDFDNIAKMLDGLNGVAFGDDAQIADGRIIKRYSERPRIVVSIGLLTAE